jgi:adhesin transport system membrane fusion protein
MSNSGVKTFRLDGDLQELPMLPAIRLTESSRLARRIAKLLIMLLIVAVIAAGFVPWQQTITGEGRVIAFDPLQRQQTVQAPIEGRIKSWGEGIRDNIYVRQGQVVLELQDNDPALRERYEQQVGFLRDKVDQANQKVAQYSGYVAALNEARASMLEAARQAIEEARNELAAKTRDLEAAKASELQKRQQRERQERLFADGQISSGGGLTSRFRVEVAQQEHVEAVQKVTAAEDYVRAAEAKVRSRQAELEQRDREWTGRIAAAEAELNVARGELAASRKELTDAESNLARLDQFLVRAPADGYVQGLDVFQAGEYVKKGDPLFRLVPETKELAVEIWVSGNDAPLAEPGRHVRLQFEGWPAVQFAGWPSVAVGTFGGTVQTVDATDDGRGRFRVVVLPDGEQEWPEPPYLRQGVRANGWVLLEQVPLGYEIWRRLNGFPATVAMEEDSATAKQRKPAKPPKPSF